MASLFHGGGGTVGSEVDVAIQGGTTFNGESAGLAPGTYPFHCKIHPTMTGTVIVLPVLPPPDTTPLLTLRLATGTPRFVDARASSACLAWAAAIRTSGPPCEIDELPPVLPVFGDGVAPPVSKEMCES